MKKPGHNYSHPFSRSAVCDQYLRQTLRGIKPEVIDYDLAVAYFLDQTDNLHIGSIPQSVDIILKDFEALRPLTGRQDDLHQCALHIKTTLDHHCTHPALEPPFALRYPTLKSLKLLHNARSELPRPIDSDRAVILVDLAGRVLAIQLPPNPRSNQETCETSKTGNISPEVNFYLQYPLI